jgi:hypothetical protein
MSSLIQRTSIAGRLGLFGKDEKRERKKRRKAERGAQEIPGLQRDLALAQRQNTILGASQAPGSTLLGG